MVAKPSKDLNLPHNLSITMYEDILAYIKLSENEKHQARVKHTDIRYHKVKHLKDNGIVNVVLKSSLKIL